jgi:hypothetical protein
MAVTNAFKGWFQARLATDPDDFDEPRGQNGWTFAFEGEPDLDRIIRVANPVSPRSHGPQVGVSITGVTVNGTTVSDHVLLGTPLQLLGDPKFEGHNGAIAPPGSEPVFPLNLKVVVGSIALEVREWLTFADLTKPIARPRFGKGVRQLDNARLLSVLGTTDITNFRATRKQALVTDLANTNDPTQKKNLQQRLAQMDSTDLPLTALRFSVPYSFKVPDSARSATDPDGTLGSGLLAQAWQLDWWMGAWDADALCGFMDGTLKIG